MERFLVKRKQIHDRSPCSSGDDRKDKLSNPLNSCDVKKPRLSEGTGCEHFSVTVKPPSSEKTPTNETVQKQDLLFLTLQVEWRKIEVVNLKCDYGLLYSVVHADTIYHKCEKTFVYNTGVLAKIHIFGKWHNIPRKQVAFGNHGLSYQFSGNKIPARPWPSWLTMVRDHVNAATESDFNFVLVNRYADGRDYIGEHKDDEKDLVQGYPIASLSLGQPRDFVFRHGESRKNSLCKIEPVKIELQHGSLLVMKHPTNLHWYHSLPQRKKLINVRINMTFRRMTTKE